MTDWEDLSKEERIRRLLFDIFEYCNKSGYYDPVADLEKELLDTKKEVVTSSDLASRMAELIIKGLEMENELQSNVINKAAITFSELGEDAVVAECHFCNCTSSRNNVRILKIKSHGKEFEFYICLRCIRRLVFLALAELNPDIISIAVNVKEEQK